MSGLVQTLIQRNGHILLGRWRTGLFTGKLTGCLGAAQPAESLEAAAARIVKELCGLRLETEHLCRRAHFRFVEHGQDEVAAALGSTYEETQLVYDGDAHASAPLQPRSSAAFEPMWVPLDSVPFDEMPEDDRYWYPDVLEHGALLCGTFEFHGTALARHAVRRCTARELADAIGSRQQI
eukprot:g6391.t1